MFSFCSAAPLCRMAFRGNVGYALSGTTITRTRSSQEVGHTTTPTNSLDIQAQIRLKLGLMSYLQLIFTFYWAASRYYYYYCYCYCYCYCYYYYYYYWYYYYYHYYYYYGMVTNCGCPWRRHEMGTLSALRGALMFSLTCACTNGWLSIRAAGDLRRHRAHNDVTVVTESPHILPLILLVLGH